ncbi:MAG: hypothetical protein GY807_07455 [Gammaproteobacteria bacterium]|nr:hypothetical protein [Gammaproteobacteria bacterium]
MNARSQLAVVKILWVGPGSARRGAPSQYQLKPHDEWPQDPQIPLTYETIAADREGEQK